MSQKSLCFLISFFIYCNVFAEPASRSFNSTGSSVKGQVARIMMSCLGGAAFGVSTLSFYGEPQKHLNNVAFGAAIGLIIGSAYVTNESLKDEYPYSFKHRNDGFIAQKSIEQTSGGPLLFLWSKEF